MYMFVIVNSAGKSTWHARNFSLGLTYSETGLIRIPVYSDPKDSSNNIRSKYICMPAPESSSYDYQQ